MKNLMLMGSIGFGSSWLQRYSYWHRWERSAIAQREAGETAETVGRRWCRDAWNWEDEIEIFLNAAWLKGQPFGKSYSERAELLRARRAEG
jgi:hypothetical protein